MFTVLIILMFSVNDCFGENISLVPAHETKCSEGLIHGVDKIKVIGTIYKETNYPVYIDISNENGTDPKSICSIDISNCSLTLVNCLCSHTGIHTYLIEIALLADKNYSESIITAHFRNAHNVKTQTNISLPQISDPPTQPVTDVMINGKNISSKCEGFKDINDTDITVTADCHSLLKPCILKLLINNHSKIEENDSLSSMENFPKDQSLRLEIQQKICSDRYTLTVAQCFKEKETPKEDLGTGGIIGIVVGCLAGLAVPITIFVLWKKKKLCFKPNSPKEKGETKAEEKRAQDREIPGSSPLLGPRESYQKDPASTDVPLVHQVSDDNHETQGQRKKVEPKDPASSDVQLVSHVSEDNHELKSS